MCRLLTYGPFNIQDLQKYQDQSGKFCKIQLSRDRIARAMTHATGTKLGRYEIRSKLGAGGMGEVYRARDEKLNRDVAIKVLPAALSDDTDRLHRFEQEAQAAGALNHPNILVIYDVGTNERAPYVVSYTHLTLPTSDLV